MLSISVCICILGMIFIAKCEDIAVSNRLSRQLCNYLDASRFERVLPESSTGGVCPVYEKDGSQKTWAISLCDKRGTGDSGPLKSYDGASDSTGNDPSDNNGPRLIHSREAPPFRHPYLVYVRSDENGKGFSGTIYNPYTIIVNANALQDLLSKANNTMERLRIHIGKHKHKKRENEEQLRFMCNYTFHGQYKQYATVHLYDPITVSRYAGKAWLAKSKQNNTLSNNCLIPGWGDNGELGDQFAAKTLRESNATVEKCPEGVNGSNIFCSSPVYCFSDSGSPLMCAEYHMIYASGIVAALGGETEKGCKASSFSIYGDLKIDELHKWIEKTYKDHEKMCRASVRAEVP